LHPNITKGFTLLELLVALTIFAVIATLAYSGLNTVLTTRLQIERHTNQLAQLQMTFARLGRDIEQYLPRPIRNEYGDLQPAFQGTVTTLELTCAGWRNPAQQPRSSLQRVAYQVVDNTLWRIYWPVLDRAQDTKPLRTSLLKDVSEIRLRFLDELQQWHEEWPPSLPPTEVVNLLSLKAVEVVLVVKEWGPLTRLFQVVDTNL